MEQPEPEFDTDPQLKCIATESQKECTETESRKESLSDAGTEEGEGEEAEAKVKDCKEKEVCPTLIFNVGGQEFQTKRENVLKHDWIGKKASQGEGSEDSWQVLENGAIFFDRAPEPFSNYIMPILRGDFDDLSVEEMNFPDFWSPAFGNLVKESVFYDLMPLRESLFRVVHSARIVAREELRRDTDLSEKEHNLRSMWIDAVYQYYRTVLLTRSGQHSPVSPITRGGERVSLGRPGFTFTFSSIIVGVTGTGKSSTFNTLAGSQICAVGGGQAQGTREVEVKRSQVPGRGTWCLVDTQGLGADTSVSDSELLENIIHAVTWIGRERVLSSIMITFDLNRRATSEITRNLLTLTELFQDAQESCFCCFTKWNTSAVMQEWNRPLKDWVKANKKATCMSEIKNDPPSYEQMNRAYWDYLNSASGQQDEYFVEKVVLFLEFFDARVLWIYNLDQEEIELEEEGELEVYKQRLFEYYRTEALERLSTNSQILMQDISLFQSSFDRVRATATRVIENRDRKVKALEECRKTEGKRKSVRQAMRVLSSNLNDRLRIRDLRNRDSVYLKQVSDAAGDTFEVIKYGCTIS